MPNTERTQSIADSLTQAAVSVDAELQELKDSEANQDKISEWTQIRTQLVSMIGNLTIKAATVSEEDTSEETTL